MLWDVRTTATSGTHVKPPASPLPDATKQYQKFFSFNSRILFLFYLISFILEKKYEKQRRILQGFAFCRSRHLKGNEKDRRRQKESRSEAK